MIRVGFSVLRGCCVMRTMYGVEYTQHQSARFLSRVSRMVWVMTKICGMRNQKLVTPGMTCGVEGTCVQSRCAVTNTGICHTESVLKPDISRFILTTLSRLNGLHGVEISVVVNDVEGIQVSSLNANNCLFQHTKNISWYNSSASRKSKPGTERL